MMKIFSINTRLLFVLLILPWVFAACAFTDYGNRINQEQIDVAKLENKRQDLETHLVIILNSLELHPMEKSLREDRDKTRQKLQDIIYQIDSKRKSFDQSIHEWEEKINQDRLEHEMIDKEVKENEDKVEQP